MSSTNAEFSPATIAVAVLSVFRKFIRRINSKDVDNTRRYDWINTVGSCHYTKDHASFMTYRVVDKTIGGSLKVVGVGTMVFEVQKTPTSSRTGRMILCNVLHIPSVIYNTFNTTLKDGSKSVGTSISMDLSEAQGTAESGLSVWYAERFCGLFRLILASNPKGQSSIRPGGGYSLCSYLTFS
ncbi:hypothetical protein BDZ45DRAFT_699147 [Acephala macrosclerotiorum]|nr:hypothetical protein BDZ45DRAFT_699147 [Acephala macrosclerotiorum]